MNKIIYLFSIYFSIGITNMHALVINKVSLVGNLKTQKKALIKWTGIEIGEIITNEELNNIKEKLKRASQFNVKNITLKENTLFIKIKDKWSLFPVPVFSQSGSYYSRGFFLYDNNFRGRLATIVPGIFWTNSGLNAIFYWQEDNLFFKKMGMKVLLIHKTELTEFRRNGELINSFETRLKTVVLTPNIHLGRHNHKLGPVYIKKNVYGKSNESLFKAERFGLFYRHHYDHYFKLPVLYDGFITTLNSFYFPQSRKSKSINTLEADIKFCKPFSKHFFRGQIHVNMSNDTGFFTSKILGGNEGHRGYDRASIPAQRNFGLMATGQFNIVNNIYFSSFYEFNNLKLIKPTLGSLSLNESALGINLSYYFSNISIPAFIFEYAYNLEDKSQHLHLNVGLSI